MKSVFIFFLIAFSVVTARNLVCDVFSVTTYGEKNIRNAIVPKGYRIYVDSISIRMPPYGFQVIRSLHKNSGVYVFSSDMFRDPAGGIVFIPTMLSILKEGRFTMVRIFPEDVDVYRGVCH